MKKPRILYLLCFVLAAVAATVYFVWNKPHPTAENEKGIAIAALQLCQQYEANEQLADKQYLGKWLAISGTIESVSSNQQNNTVIVLSGTELSSVICTLATNNPAANKGSKVVVKGFCSGYLMPDVRVDRGILMME